MTPTPFRKFSLFTRLLFLCLGATAIVVTVAMAGLHYYRNQVNTDQLAVELANTAQMISPVLVEQMANADIDAAGRTLRIFASAHFVKCADVFYNGSHFVSWPRIDCTKIAGDFDILSLPVATAPGQLAKIKLLVDTSSFQKQLMLETFLLGAVILVIVLVIFLVLTISFRAVVLRPLDLLKTAMVESTPRGPVRGQLVHDDEIGALVKVYNKLVAGSRLYIRRLDQSQASLAASEKRFRDLAEVSGDWFFEMDADLRLSFISDTFFELTGLKSEDVIGKSRGDLAADNQENMGWQKHFDDLVAHREFRRFEYQVRTPDGSPLDVSISAVPLHDDNGNFTGYRGIGADITEFKEKEHQLEEANRNFGDSVSYASSIQRGLLPNVDQLSHHLGTTRTIWQPKDVVGGDFYWCRTIGNVDYLVFFDCTGHGVPGAFMTLIVTSVLEQIAVSAPSAPSAQRVLELVHDGVCRSLNITKNKMGADGLDCATIRLDRSEDSLEFAGASIDLFVVAQDGSVERHRGSRATLGYDASKGPDKQAPVSLRIGSNAFVMTTDGMLTQVGEATKRVMGTRRFGEALGEVGNNSPAKLIRAVAMLLKNWQGREERRDDISVICFKPNDF